MIKRLRKFRQSKKGAILVMVVLILALAMIFIASAMMLTQATRGRLYKNTMASQARLTVTTAAEVFLEALETQEITDAQLDAMLLGTGDTPEPKQRHTNNAEKIKMVVSGVPGMSSAADNCTYLDLYFPDTSNKNLVYADFTTIIGEETENVRAVLKVNNQQSNLGGRFSNQIEIAANVGTSELRFTDGIGMYNTDLYSEMPDDNTILMRSAAVHEQTSGSIFFSNTVFAGGNDMITDIGGGNYYHGDIIFRDGSYFGSVAGGKDSAVAGIDGSIYFLGSEDDYSFVNTGNGNVFSGTMKPTNVVFAGRVVQKDTQEDRNKKVQDVLTQEGTSCYFVDSSGNSLGEASYTIKNTTNTTGYVINNKANDSVASNIKHTVTWFSNVDGNGYTVGDFPSGVDDIFDDILLGKATAPTGGITLDYDAKSPDGKITYPKNTPIPAGTEYVLPLTKEYPSYELDSDGKPKHTINMSSLGSNSVIDLDPGIYLITCDGDSVETAATMADTKYFFCINGAQAENYRFYFDGGKTFYLNNVVFAMYNVSDNTKDHSTIFVMEQDAKVFMSSCNFKLSDDSSVLCSSGFLSMPRSGSASAVKSYVQSTSYFDESKAWSTNWYYGNEKPTALTSDKVIKYSQYYDSETRPAMFIYGVGGNTLKMGDSCILEAYIGMYGGSKFGVAEGTSTILPIYGRIEVDSFENGDAGGDHPIGKVQMPYCPQPKQDDSKPVKRTAGSKYSVYDIIYYYDNLAPADEG